MKKIGNILAAFYIMIIALYLLWKVIKYYVDKNWFEFPIILSMFIVLSIFWMKGGKLDLTKEG